MTEAQLSEQYSWQKTTIIGWMRKNAWWLWAVIYGPYIFRIWLRVRYGV